MPGAPTADAYGYRVGYKRDVDQRPFDFPILSRVLRSLSATAVKQIAYNLTGGYQVGAVKPYGPIQSVNNAFSVTERVVSKGD